MNNISHTFSHLVEKQVSNELLEIFLSNNFKLNKKLKYNGTNLHHRRYLQHKGVQNKASAGLRTITQRIENVKS